MPRAQRLIGRLGDVGFPEYDGGLVFRTPYGCQMEWLEWFEDGGEDDGQKAYVYRCDVPDANSWRNEWWAKDLPGIASYTGQSVQELEAAFSSKDPVKRASEIYYSVRGCTTLDHDPLVLTRKEVMQRFARSGPRRKRVR